MNYKYLSHVTYCIPVPDTHHHVRPTSLLCILQFGKLALRTSRARSLCSSLDDECCSNSAIVDDTVESRRLHCSRIAALAGNASGFGATCSQGSGVEAGNLKLSKHLLVFRKISTYSTRRNGRSLGAISGHGLA